MPSEIPVIQVLSRHNYEDQHIVQLPNAFPLPEIGPSCLRIRSTILSLTTNNLTYARVGHLLGWWDIHPLPPSIPAEFSNSKDYGRISAWGYGKVIESNVPGIQTGSHVYGYLPIGTLPVDMEVRIDTSTPRLLWETSKHRQNTMPIYNRYTYYSVESTPDRENQGIDALMQTLFKCGFLINRFIFPWNEAELLQPLGGANEGWTFENVKVGDDTTFLLFSASGKTGLATAYCLKNGRPAGSRPGKIIAVGSTQSKKFTEDTKLFNNVLTYDADKEDLATVLDLSSKSKIVICNFGARDSADQRWATKLENDGFKVTQLRIGGEVVVENPQTVTEKFKKSVQAKDPQKARFNASGVTFKAIDLLGEERFYDEYASAWETAKQGSFRTWIKLVWGEGMDELGTGWERLCRGEVRPDEGLVFDLDHSGDSGDNVSSEKTSSAHRL